MNKWLIYLFSFISLFYVTFEDVQTVWLCKPWKFTESVIFTKARHSATFSANRLMINNPKGAVRRSLTVPDYMCVNKLSVAVRDALNAGLLLIVKGTLWTSIDTVSKCYWLCTASTQAMSTYRFHLINFIIWNFAIPNSLAYRVTLHWNRATIFSNSIRNIIITYRNFVNSTFLFCTLCN